MTNFAISNPDRNKEWIYPIEEFKYWKGCSICSKSRCNAQLSCKHAFHLKCLLIWINNVWSCPKCKGAVLDIRIFCTSCFKQYQNARIEVDNH